MQNLTTAGDVTVPARKLFDICRSLPEGSQLKINVEHHKLTLSAANGRFSLSTLPSAEFPKTKEATEGVEVTLKVAQLKQMIERTQFAMAQQDVRYYLNGSLWQIENGLLTTVATDGHRLSLFKIPVSQEGSGSDAKVIVPRKAILEIARIIQEVDDTIKFVIGASNVRFYGEYFCFNLKIN